MTKMKIKPVRGKDGKFKKPDPIFSESAEEEEDKPQRLEQLVKVSGQSTRSAQLQSHNLKKGKDGAMLPELVEGAKDNGE